MRFRRQRPKDSLTGRELVEVVTPRTNAAVIAAAENLLAALSGSEPFSLEIAATGTTRLFLVRAVSASIRRQLQAQLAVAYPQAALRRIDVERYPSLDPAYLGPREQLLACTLALRCPPYLPLRIFWDIEVAAAQSAQADPVLGILGAMGDLPDGWRGLAQLVLGPAPDDWCRDYLRLAVEHPLASERTAGPGDTSLNSVFTTAGLLGTGLLAAQGYQWYAAGDWLRLGFLAGGMLIGAPGLFWLVRRLTNRPIYDMRQVQEKISRIAYLGEIRLAIFAPGEASPSEVQSRLDGLAAAYRQFNLAAGNGFVTHQLKPRGLDLRHLAFLGPGRRPPLLNTRELAGLWHLPQAPADVPLLERTTARQLLPLPASVAQGCRIGVSSHQGLAVTVSLPDELLRRHLLLVAKTRRGKSSLLLHFARYRMASRSDTMSPALLIVDPHHDLSRAALGLVPASRRQDVVYLDVSERQRPFGLNVLDTGLGWDRDKAVANTLAIFKREFDRFWGPRMEDAFRFALLTLYEANEAICAADATGRGRQHTVLDVPAVLVNPAFRRGVLRFVADPVIRHWWSGYFDLLDRRLQIEIANPVQTKVQRFAGSRAARNIVGQPHSTIAPHAWLQTGALVIVNTAKGVVGEDTAALIGATLLNLTALVIGEQAKLKPAKRRPITLLVDEFHTMPGADYEAILSELAKYGANLVLATQSLGRLAALDREQGRGLHATVFANLDGLFAFHCSAEDARYLVPELGGEVDEADLVVLGEHQCYAKLSAGGERLPTFSVHLDPPPSPDQTAAAEIAAISASLYGRDCGAVETDLRSALARIEASHRALFEESQSGAVGSGVAKDAVATDGQVGAAAAGRKRARNEHRREKPSRTEAYQALLFGASNGATSAPPGAVAPAEVGERQPEGEPER